MEKRFNVIVFKGTGDVLSTVYPVDFVWQGHTVKCVKQALMIEKARFFNRLDIVDKMLLATRESEWVALGRSIDNYVDERWAAVREGVMMSILLARFQQDDIGHSVLGSTGNYFLVEACDSVWGVGLAIDDPDIFCTDLWCGQNLVGKCLMAVREILCFNRNSY